MFTLFGIGFAYPLLLLALIGLPVLWILLRAVPPAPIRRAFPGVALLLGLSDEASETDRTPWWLLLLRTLAVAGLILGFAGPVLNPEDASETDGPLLIISDASWASAPRWTEVQERFANELSNAARQGRPVAVVRLTDLAPAAETLTFRPASEWQDQLSVLEPLAWEPDMITASDWGNGLSGPFDTVWFSDGLERERSGLLSALEARGGVTILQDDLQTLAVRPAAFENGQVAVPVLRSIGTSAQTVIISGVGPDPAGVVRNLARATAEFGVGETEALAGFDVPPELRNRFVRFEVEGVGHAGAVALADDSLRRREVALFSGREDREGLQLLSPTHYLRQALAPTADLLDGTLTDILPANPDVIILADVATLSEGESEAIEDWVNAGGLLLRFAGPRLANSDVGRDEEHPLMPVRLRSGGRSIGGAMSWGDPRALRPFGPGSPFFGLEIPADVQVTAQVLAQPDPTLAERTIAALDDGTPLVTRKPLGDGQVVLVHVTANAEWSSLPLSGLFVQMLERLAVSTRPAVAEPAELAGTLWQPDRLLDGFGQLQDAGNSIAVAGEELAAFQPSAATPPGLYLGPDRTLALNTIAGDRTIAPAEWPARVAIQPLFAAQPQLLGGYALALALLLLLADAIASLWISGRLSGGVPLKAAMLGGLVAAAASFGPDTVRAQSTDTFALDATAQTVLAYVLTGDAQVDRISQAGLRGLSDTLFARTSVEPAEPIGVDLERDELSFFPLIYWPVTTAQDIPSADAYARLNRYLRGGGMILFDTKDSGVSGVGGSSPNGQKLQTLALPLDVPPLEPIPEDHILTRTFYLLQDFPGRYASRDVWVEAAPADAQQAEGMPFRNLNDNVTPVVIGGNDWASAWAVDGTGSWMFPVGRGLTGERQREFALRFGVNLVMHVLTGNYKSDQVHVPALLDRLGQ